MNKKYYTLTFSVTQKQRRRRSKFCFLWGAFLLWASLASHVSVGWLTWVPLPLTIATNITISHGRTVRSALHWLEDTSVDNFQNCPQLSAKFLYRWLRKLFESFPSDLFWLLVAEQKLHFQYNLIERNQVMLDLVSRGAILMDLLVQSISHWNFSWKSRVRWVQNVAEHRLVEATFFVLLLSQRSPIVQVNGPLTTLSVYVCKRFRQKIRVHLNSHLLFRTIP